MVKDVTRQSIDRFIMSCNNIQCDVQRRCPKCSSKFLEVRKMSKSRVAVKYTCGTIVVWKGEHVKKVKGLPHVLVH